jgi:1-acyl-sn-glycerol-3-phosphate acyltransferase
VGGLVNRRGAAALVAGLRTIVWHPLFYAGSLVIVLLALLFLPFSTDWFRSTPRWWARWQVWLGRWVLGQEVIVDGTLPNHPVLVVMKHEAMHETIHIMLLLRQPVVFAKAELFRIPLWGPLARIYGLIAINREGGAAALRHMLAQAQGAVAAGRSLVLCPEGTRVAVGEAPDIRAGFAGLYKLLDLPVVPLAVASGHVGPRPGWIRWPGVIRYRVGDEIPAGLPRGEAEALAHAAINALNGPDRLAIGSGTA